MVLSFLDRVLFSMGAEFFIFSGSISRIEKGYIKDKRIETKKSHIYFYLTIACKNNP